MINGIGFDPISQYQNTLTLFSFSDIMIQYFTKEAGLNTNLNRGNLQVAQISFPSNYGSVNVLV